MFFDDFSSQIERQKINTPVLQWLPRRDLRPGYLMIFHVFRVLPDPLQDRRVDFLTLNLDEKSCYFRVFFACFLIHCETGVLIF